MMPVKFRSRAIGQINKQIAYYQDVAPHVLELFREDMRKTISVIQTFPLIGHRGDVADTREIVSSKFRFIIVYTVEDTHLDIIRIFFRGQNR